MTEKMGPLSIGTTRPEMVLFVRLDEGEDLDNLTEKRALIPSSRIAGDYAVLLNASPGTYVAVAALYGEDVEGVEVPVASTNVGPHVTATFSLEMFAGEVVHRNYFSREMIAATMTRVDPASFAFMGSYRADQSFRFGDADDLQRHFLRVIEGEDVDRSGFFSDLTSSDWAKRLTLTEVRRDAMVVAAFAEQAMDDLKGSGWVPMLEALRTGD
jgi:hypothetical protein